MKPCCMPSWLVPARPVKWCFTSGKHVRFSQPSEAPPISLRSELFEVIRDRCDRFRRAVAPPQASPGNREGQGGLRAGQSGQERDASLARVPVRVDEVENEHGVGGWLAGVQR